MTTYTNPSAATVAQPKPNSIKSPLLQEPDLRFVTFEWGDCGKAATFCDSGATETARSAW